MFVHKLQLVAAVALILGLAVTDADVWLQSAPAGTNPLPLAGQIAAADPIAPLDTQLAKEEMLRPRERIRQTRRALSQNVSLPAFGAGTTLNDALDTLSAKFKVTFIVNEDAFNAISVPKPGETAVSLPKITNVPLRTVLTMILKQVKGDRYTGAYLVRPHGIELTTVYHVWLEAGADPLGLHGEGLWDPAPGAARDPRDDDEPIVDRELGYFGKYRRMTTVVQVDCEQQPLTEALRDLSEETGYDIVVDPRVRDKAKTPVTLFLNVAWLDNAVTLLTEMADLDWYWMDRVLFVTSCENAKLHKDKIKALHDRRFKQ